jgi:hypothetical protein
MQGQYTHYILLPVAKLSLKTKTARYNWNTYTYKDVEKTGTRKVNKYDYNPPTLDNLKAEIKAYMDDAGADYDSNDTKAELLEKLHNTAYSTPQKDEEYKYTEQEVDTTTVHKPSWQDYIDRHPNYVAARYSPDRSEVLLKSDFTMAELKEVEGVDGASVFNNAEAKAYIKSNWED